jgi:OmpA-OmpF porin, OOP family
MQQVSKGWRVVWSALALCGLGLMHAAAHAESGEDHPEVARFPGSRISHYDFKEYEEFRLILSKPVNRKSEWVADKTLDLEGRVTYVHYDVPKSASPLQVFRNYQSSLKRSGFKDLFVCERPCTEANLGSFQDLMKAPKHYLNYSTDNQFLAAQRNGTYVSLWVNDGGVWLHVVEKQSLNDGLMEVRGESPMAKSLNADGKVDVYGFQFDTGKALLKDGSKPTLQELGKVLQDNPNLNIEVVGHTDDVGGPDANQRLSEQRAAAVADALTKGYGIASNRLSTRGMGQTAPLEPNTTEAGRAKNRRVEIIAQLPPAAAQPTANYPSNPPARSTPPAPPAPTQPAEPANKSGGLIDSANKAMDAAGKLKNLLGF